MLLITIVFNFLSLVADGILSCLLIQLTFHEDIEEEGNRREVCHLTAYISRPEKWMLLWVFMIGEADEVYSNVAKDIF